MVIKHLILLSAKMMSHTIKLIKPVTNDLQKKRKSWQMRSKGGIFETTTLRSLNDGQLSASSGSEKNNTSTSLLIRQLNCPFIVSAWKLLKRALYYQ